MNDFNKMFIDTEALQKSEISKLKNSIINNFTVQQTQQLLKRIYQTLNLLMKK